MASESAELEYVGRDLKAMAFAHNYHRWIRDECTPHLHGDVAEVGAGDGEFSRLLLDCEPRSLALFEPSRRMFELQGSKLGERANLQRHCSTFEAYAANQPPGFDTVCYINVLEHIEHEARELALAFAALRPGGTLCVFVPALTWLMSRFDRDVGHQRRYQRPALMALARDAGFVIERCHYFDIAGVLPWLVVMRWLGGDLSPRSVNAYDRLVVPVMRRIEPIVRPPFGKNLLLIARKPG